MEMYHTEGRWGYVVDRLARGMKFAFRRHAVLTTQISRLGMHEETRSERRFWTTSAKSLARTSHSVANAAARCCLDSAFGWPPNRSFPPAAASTSWCQIWTNVALPSQARVIRALRAAASREYVILPSST